MKKSIPVYIIYLAVIVMTIFMTSAQMIAFQAPASKNDDSAKNKNIERIDTIRAIVFSWAEAWSNKDIINYMAYYSPKFKAGNINYQLWRGKKSEVFKRPGAISVEILDLWVFVEGHYATASFIQKYKDAIYSDVGEKVLNLIYTNGRWQIVSEKWHPLKQ